MADTPGLSVMNLALSHIGQLYITQTELNNNSTVQTQAILRIWAMLVKETLRAADWGFARVEEVLEEHSTYEPVNYEYAYSYPENCVAVRRVFNASTTKMSIGQKFAELYDPDSAEKVICTDVSDAYARYTYHVTDTTVWDDAFTLAFSHKLAAALAVTLNGDEDTAKNQIAIYNNLVSEAKRASQEETDEVNDSVEESPIVDSRGA